MNSLRRLGRVLMCLLLLRVALAIGRMSWRLSDLALMLLQWRLRFITTASRLRS